MTIDAFRAAVDAVEPLVQSWMSLVGGGKPASLVVRTKNNKLVVDSHNPSLSAHGTLAVSALLPQLRAAALAMDAAFNDLPWARHKAQRLSWSVGSAGHDTISIGRITAAYLPTPHLVAGQHKGLRGVEARVLDIHQRLDGISVEPTDPVWKVASKPVGACNGGTAHLLATVFDDPQAPLAFSRFKTVVLVVDAQTLRTETAAALQHQQKG
jgi:hypothetical protein